MGKKCKILFYNTDAMGVNYYRTLMPALELDKLYGDDFQVEINPNINFDDPDILNYLTSFDIIHYHKEFCDNRKYNSFRKALRDSGTKMVMDIDDYWELSKSHPLYLNHAQNKIHLYIKKALRENADYITTTTDLFASEIRKVTGKDNVITLFNAIDPDNMVQFQDNWQPDPDGRVRITYMGGSSHLPDLIELERVVNVLHNDLSTRDKFKIILAGWDDRGKTTDTKHNPELLEELKAKGLYTNKILKLINHSKGNIEHIKEIPSKIREKYFDNVFTKTERELTAPESVYNKYEQILTDNHKIISDKEYITFLHLYDKNGKYSKEGNFGRRWTQNVNIYANVLNESDIVIAPLEDNIFNRMKSNLKQVECWSRRLPIVCSDIPPYNVDGKHMENCILIPSKSNSKKYWIKYLKILILNPELRKQLGEQLYLDFKDKYNLTTVTKTRADFYKKIMDA
jgi:glycosyltransferase involved in cell wall biosynthesis